ncbi:unnamed protein product [Effrenium voratum]|nr:unnamed protein product [Effrenium voratum]
MAAAASAALPSAAEEPQAIAPAAPDASVSPAAASLQARLSQSFIEVKVPLSNVRARVAMAGFMFTTRRREAKRSSFTGVMAMLDDFFPVSCVFRRHGCWPKKKGNK